MNIWKYPLKFGDARRVVLEMPYGAKLLCLQLQNEEPCLWAQVDPTGKTVERTFAAYLTGQTLPDDPQSYVGTFQVSNAWGIFVLHVYEVF